MDLRLQSLRKDPNYTAREDEMNRAINAALSSSSADYTLPVVVHIISESPFAITDVLIQNALKDLNDAFSKQGAYIAGVGVDTKIQFCLASKDPDGGNTTGITRTKSFLTNFDLDMEDERMKNLIQWDPSRFINIWYTTDITSEIMATFECGIWDRLKAGGYATMPPYGGATDGIVVTGFGPLLVHEMGHYLGLYHTFEGRDCSNSDCTTNGDRVCDTPPDRSIKNSPSCASPENSCSSDTLSGFPTDVPDMISNFMDYGNNACHTDFTEGQAARMRAVLATQRSGLLVNQCDKPCAENIVAGFTRNNPYPLPGDVINFTNTTSGASVYQWTIDNSVVATTANFSHSFSAQGKYKVTLKAYNADAACYSNYTDYIIVSCGVMARFYPDKRLIASKQNIQLDSIFFKNRSENATSYNWLMSNSVGMSEQVISTATDLKYLFLNPGDYTVRLIATNGTCTDTTERFNFSVLDPTADGQLYLSTIYCYQETKVRVSFSVCNDGFVAIPANMPISFYDDDPRKAGAHKLKSTFFLPVPIPGKCCGSLYTHTLDVGAPGLDKLYAVLNDSGNVIPIVLPGTKLVEKNYTNNIQSSTNFKFKVKAAPPLITAERGDTLQLNATAGPNNTVAIQWTPTENMSCVSCFNPKLIATRDTIEKVTAVSQFGCSDSAFINIKVPPSDDYTIIIDSIDCAANNKLHVSFTICNSFKRGDIPKNLMLSFYDSDPSSANAHLLGPAFVVNDTVHSLCASFEHIFQGTNPGNKIYAVVNDNGTTIPLVLPNQKSITEKNYLNNITSILYQPSVIKIQPGDTTILRKTQAQFSISGPVYNAASVKWFPGNGYTLSCQNCLSPIATAYDSSIIKMEAANKYGCMIKGEAKLNILPADMVVSILETSCISNGYTKVKFRLCMNNGYDSVFKNIPVSFYDGDPSTGKAKLLPPLFLTPEVRAGDCAEFTQIIKSPHTNKLFAAVNDKGKPSLH
jgi:plastocyanin